MNDGRETVLTNLEGFNDAPPCPVISCCRDPDQKQRRIPRGRGNRTQNADPVDDPPDFRRLVVEEAEEVPSLFTAIYIFYCFGDFTRSPACTENDEILSQRD